MINRRMFSKALAVTAVGMVLGAPHTAFADDSETAAEIAFTPEIARALGENFAKTMASRTEMSVYGVRPFFDPQGLPLGYVVQFCCEGAPHGYVVFEPQDELVSEYSLAEGVVGPGFVFGDQGRSVSNDIIIRMNPLLFALVDGRNGEGHDDLGRPVSIDGGPLSRATLNQMMIRYDQLFVQYTVISDNTVEQFSAFDQEYLQKLDSSGRYACSVASGFAVCDNYGALNGSNMANDFRTLWSLIGPHKTSSGWSADLKQTATGVKTFCQRRGKTVLTEVMASKPSMSKIQKHIDAGNLLTLGLHTSSEDHGVTVEGYAFVTKLGTRASGGNPMLIIYDGWHSYPRCIRYDAAFTSVQGAFYVK
ncbi:hypothetical protein [Adlercreutzia caecimuris]|uniref:Peptidase C39-like domain-containing protein n=1 Tax=Adlercreutzia caecimuris TaxID=671266 RepID=A0A4S4G5P3_9ACTN|nr:hypothetical protein [Adlercreutzia caecimuris]THG38723.1 hypothetical protein E5986_00010 [Adlercreutzia caecimuris]